ncbi:TetR family transcriptional regulator [soil metagenome]
MTSLESGRKRRERGSITPDEIVEGAFAVAERDTIDSLSVPEVAKYLGVGVTSIYWHFRKKEDLLRAMSDEAIRAVQQLMPSTNTSSGWRDFLAEYFTTMRDVYRTNDTIADLVLIRMSDYSRSSTNLSYEAVDRIVRMLVTAGFTPLNAWHVNATLSTFTRGIIMSERMQRMQRLATVDERQVRLLVPESMPYLSDLVGANSISLSMASDEDFAFGLSIMLSAFERLLQTDRAAAADH